MAIYIIEHTKVYYCIHLTYMFMKTQYNIHYKYLINIFMYIYFCLCIIQYRYKIDIYYIPSLFERANFKIYFYTSNCFSVQ